MYVCYSYTMGMSGLPDMYTRGPRQTANAHGITVICHTAPPLASWKQLKPGTMEVCKPIAFIGKVVGIDCGFLLMDTHFNCGFWYHFCITNIII